MPDTRPEQRLTQAPTRQPSPSEPREREAPVAAEGHGESARSIAESLAAPLEEACRRRLHDLTWFRTDWQRGGAATAHGEWDDDGNGRRPVVVKLPVNARELHWMRRLQETGDGVVPKLYMSGEAIDSYELAWIVIERLPHGPLGGRWHDDHVRRIARAIARFSSAASAFPVDREPRQERWDLLVARAREEVRANAVTNQQRWMAALRELSGRIDRLSEEWAARQPLEWLHGDLHLANAMSRDGMDQGDVCLIDLAEVHVGHWVEDAIYLERQLWARPERLKPHKPLRAIAEERRANGCPAGEEYTRLAMLRRLLLAATAPAFLKSEGAPAYLGACLDRVEDGLRHTR